MGSQHETVFLACSAFDAGQELRGHLDHSATALADEVGVDVVGEVIDGAAVAQDEPVLLPDEGLAKLPPLRQERSGEYKDNEHTADERANQRLDQRRTALFPWVDGNTRVVPPDITFKERMTITIGERRLTLLYAGPAHSSSDIMMMVEPDGVLFAGDIVQNGRIPFMNSDDVSTMQWLQALDEVARLDPKYIIPGHGRTSTRASQAIAFTRDYIQYVRNTMATAVQNWTDFDVAYEQADWSKYREMPAFASNNRGNAYRIYLELERSRFKADKP